MHALSHELNYKSYIEETFTYPVLSGTFSITMLILQEHSKVFYIASA